MKNKIKLLIIGRNSFLGSNLFRILKNKIYIKKISYQDFLLFSKAELTKFNFIVNCSLHPDYIKKKYNKRFDFDYQILNIIKKLDINYIFFSTRKVYFPKFNINEKENLRPQDNYALNKLTTEKFIRNMLPNNYIILRISNIVGLRNNPNNKSHSLFIDNFILYVKNRFIPRYDGVYKDFITIEQFAKIFLLILKKNLKGIFNISLGKKIFINDITIWLTRHSPSSFKPNKLYYKTKNFNSDSFTLNNSKIKKALNISIKKNELKNYCLHLSKKIFFNK